jgi:hypothetical protein
VSDFECSCLFVGGGVVVVCLFVCLLSFVCCCRIPRFDFFTWQVLVCANFVFALMFRCVL